MKWSNLVHVHGCTLSYCSKVQSLKNWRIWSKAHRIYMGFNQEAVISSFDSTKLLACIFLHKRRMIPCTSQLSKFRKLVRVPPVHANIVVEVLLLVQFCLVQIIIIIPVTKTRRMHWENANTEVLALAPLRSQSVSSTPWVWNHLMLLKQISPLSKSLRLELRAVVSSQICEGYQSIRQNPKSKDGCLDTVRIFLQNLDTTNNQRSH